MISGEEEGLLTSLGVHSSFENLQNYLIVDIGGQSTELITDTVSYTHLTLPTIYSV